MSAIPPCGLACRISRADTFLKNNKKNFLIYSIFYVLIIEAISLLIRYEKNYACFWYPLFTQIGFFLFSFTFYLWNEKLRFCILKNASLLLLSWYYLFGTIALIFNFSDSFYYSVTSNTFLAFSSLLLIYSFYNKK